MGKREREIEKDNSTNKKAKLDETKLLAGGGSIKLSQPDDDVSNSNKQERRTSPRLKNDPCFYCDNNSYDHIYYGLGFCNDCAGENGINVSIALGVPTHKIKQFDPDSSYAESLDEDDGERTILVQNVLEKASQNILRNHYNPFFSYLKFCFDKYLNNKYSFFLGEELFKRRTFALIQNLTMFIFDDPNDMMAGKSFSRKLEFDVGLRVDALNNLLNLYPSIKPSLNNLFSFSFLDLVVSGMSLPYPRLTEDKWLIHITNCATLTNHPKTQVLQVLKDKKWQKFNEPSVLITDFVRSSKEFQSIVDDKFKETIKAVKTAEKSLLKKEKRKRSKQQKAEKAKAEKIKATPVKVKKPKNLLDAFIASPNGERFPPRRNSAGADDCKCSMNKVIPSCALHSKWKAKYDKFVREFDN